MNVKTKRTPYRVGGIVLACVLAAGMSAATGQDRPGAGQKAGAQQKPEAGAKRPGQAALPANVKLLRDVEYAKVGEKSLALDLYLPDHPAGTKMALVIWVHGGAWRAGSKNPTPAVALLRDGLAVASISYRFSQAAKFPAQINDCKGAVRFLRANAAKYGLDPNAFGAWGSSAGGHLVALMGTAGDANDLEGDVGGNVGVSSHVQAVCDFFGPTDFLAMKGLAGTIQHMSADSPESQLLGVPVAEIPALARKASPTTYVSKDDPPFLIVHGDRDMTVPYQQSELLHEALTRAGVASELYIVKGAGHGGFRDPAVPEKVRAFFLKTLKGAAPAATAPPAGGK